LVSAAKQTNCQSKEVACKKLEWSLELRGK
jgi:hypothetical protein